jgi:hypothetical protein
MSRKRVRRVVGMGFEVAQWALGLVAVALVAVLARLDGLAHAWRRRVGAAGHPPTPAPAPNERKGGGTSYLHLSRHAHATQEIPTRADPPPSILGADVPRTRKNSAANPAIPGRAAPLWVGVDLGKQDQTAILAGTPESWADTLGDEWLPPQERGVPIPTEQESAPRKISQEISGNADGSGPHVLHVLALREVAAWFRDRHQPNRAEQCEKAAAVLEQRS